MTKKDVSLEKAKKDFKTMQDYSIVSGKKWGDCQAVYFDILKEYGVLNRKTNKLSRARYFSIEVFGDYAEAENAKTGKVVRINSHGKVCSSVEACDTDTALIRRITKARRNAELSNNID